MTDDKIAGWISFVLALFTLASVAYVLPIAWGWHVVPLGLPAVTGSHALGLIFLKSIVFFRYNKREPQEQAVAQLNGLFAVWVGLAFCWFAELAK